MKVKFRHRGDGMEAEEIQIATGATFYRHPSPGWVGRCPFCKEEVYVLDNDNMERAPEGSWCGHVEELEIWLDSRKAFFILRADEE